MGTGIDRQVHVDEGSHRTPVDASILLLDEPTTGLDAPSRRRLLDMIDEERRGDRTVLCATHDLRDAARATW